MRRSRLLATFAAILLAGAAPPRAAEVNPSTEYRDRVKVAETVQPLGETPFGESINLYKGGLSFRQTDINFPGTGPVITLSRSYSVGGGEARGWAEDEMGDWALSTPRIQTILPGDKGGKTGAWLVGTTSTARCSSFGKISVSPYLAFAQHWWNGYQLLTADGASQPLLRRTAENPLKPSSGTYNIVTTGHWMVSCLPSTSNGIAGEAFLATAPDGTRYWFDHLVYGPALPTLEYTAGGGSRVAGSGERNSRIVGGEQKSETTPTVSAGGTVVYLPRKMGYMMATRVEDRFGNWIRYNYSGKKLTSITASDGRKVTVAWRSDAPVIASMTIEPETAAPQTWSYQYAGTKLLSGVVLPDQSRWSFAMNAVDQLDVPAYEQQDLSACGVRGYGNGVVPITGTATVTHPSGLKGVFEIGQVGFGRANVPTTCSSNGGISTENMPTIYVAQSLVRKTLSGPGVPNRTWRYLYADAKGSSATECQASGCQRTASMEVVAPDGSVSRYVHSNAFDYSEGKLLSATSGLAATGQATDQGLQTVTKTYFTPLSGPYPTRIGDGLDHHGVMNNEPAETLSPEAGTATVLQGVTFSRTVTEVDAYANPVRVVRASSGGSAGNFSTTEVTAYRHDLAKWVLALPTSLTCVGGSDCGAGKAISSTEYDAANLPYRTYAFGRLQKSMGYDAAGNLASIADGRGNATLLGDWYRGVPRNIRFADGTTTSAVVTPTGLLSSVLDQASSKTCYEYDAMGRMVRVVLPSEERPATCSTGSWKDTVRNLVQVPSAEYGVPAGHWRQTVTTGAARVTTILDAFWRPVVELTEDTGNSASRGFVVTRYDESGKVAFKSYPVATLGTVDDPLKGTSTRYDAIGRPVQVRQDSESIGGVSVLTSTTSYLPGFRTQVTNPRGYSTTTSYQAYDSANTDLPVLIQQPETMETRIARQPSLGKPLAITRSGRYGSENVSLSRQYVYDGNELLCKTINPESGATLTSYDAAGNIAWSSEGSSLVGDGCTLDQEPDARKTTFGYDALNRQIAKRTPGGVADLDTSYHPTGQTQSIRVANPLGGPVTTSYSYYRRGLLAHETSTNGSTQFGLDYGYDAYGQLSSLTYPDNHVVSFAPDALGRVTRVSGSDGSVYASALSYAPNGAIRGFTYGNGVVHSMQSNERLLPTRSVDSFAAPEGLRKVIDDTYLFDGNGNVTDIIDQAQGGLTTRGMAYDGLDRLTAAVSPMQWGNATYAYDPLDNLREANQGARAYRYHYNGINRLDAITSPTDAPIYSFTYDERGNTTSKNTSQYVFDVANRLSQVAGSEAYRYDGLGRRVQTTDAEGKTTFWIYSQAGQVLYTSEARRSQNLSYIYLGNTQLATRAVAWGSGTTTIRYQHTDALGSPVAETDTSGNVVKRNSFTPYGETFGATVIDGTGYTGHVMDRATGLTYMQQRYYDPATSRFLSADPVESSRKDGWNFNRHTYAAANPYKFKDPDGRIIDTILDIGFIAYDVIQIAQTGATATNMAALGADVASALVPGMTGGGMMVRASAKAENIYRGSRLARNMERAGNGVRRGEQEAHHVVARTDRRAAGSREILERNGVGIDSAENGAAMSRSDHRGVHTSEMHAKVEQRLQAAEARGTDAASRAHEVRCELACMRNELQDQGRLSQ